MRNAGGDEASHTMSASASIPAADMPPPTMAHPQAEAEAPPRRPSWRAYMKRLRSDPESAYRLSEPEIVPIGAEDVLCGVAKLIAKSETEGFFAAPRRSGLGSLERRVLRELGKMAGPNAEEQVEKHLQTLERAAFIVRTDAGVGLKLPPERIVEAAALDSGGVRVPNIPKSLGSNEYLSDEQARGKLKAMKDGRAAFAAGDVAGLMAAWDRVFAIQPHLRRKWETWTRKPRPAPTQPSFMLTIPGGAARTTADIQIQYSADIDIERAANIDTGGELNLPANIEASRPPTDDDDDIESDILSESSSSSDARGNIGAGNIEAGNIDGQSEVAISDMAREQGRLFAAAIGKPGQGALLAREIDRLVTSDPAKAHQIPDLVARAGRIYAGGDHVSSPTALLRTMYQKERQRPAETARAAASPPAPGKTTELDPRLAAEPAWASQPAEVRVAIVKLLDEFDHAGPLKSKSWIQHYARDRHAGFLLVCKKYPDVERIAEVGWEQYLEEQTAAG